MLIGNMSNMYVERDSFWSRIRILETELVHPTPRGLELKFIPRCSLHCVYNIFSGCCHLQESKKIWQERLMIFFSPRLQRVSKREHNNNELHNHLFYSINSLSSHVNGGNGQKGGSCLLLQSKIFDIKMCWIPWAMTHHPHQTKTKI